MKNFAQRDFVNSSLAAVGDTEKESAFEFIGKFTVLCLSTLGVVLTFAQIYMAQA